MIPITLTQFSHVPGRAGYPITVNADQICTLQEVGALDDAVHYTRVGMTNGSDLQIIEPIDVIIHLANQARIKLYQLLV
jgi:hypothetical protein